MLLPVYWGVPDDYEKPDVAFSVNGLAPLQTAMADRLESGLDTPVIGLFRADAVTSWGAALNGPWISDTVAQIGPGYNDTAVPGRSKPTRDREDGDFYRWSWERVMRSGARIVLIETWNEHHEATGISETVEHGRRYVQLTSRYAEAWKAGRTIDSQIELRYPDPIARPNSAEGAEYAGVPRVSITFGQDGEQGISLVRGVADGAAAVSRYAREPVVTSIAAQTTYFSVADPFSFDETSGLSIEYEYLDSGHAWHMLQYDSHDRHATLSGAYTNAPRIESQGTGEWRTVRLELPDARFANRQNGGADFRFAIAGGSFTIRRIVVER